MTALDHAPGGPPGRFTDVPRREHVRDVRDGRVGEITQISRDEYGRAVKIWLRPVGGGCEWTAAAEDVRVVQDHEQEQP